MTSVRKAGLWVLMATLCLFFAGCSTKTLDPTQIGRFRSTPAVNVILDSLGVAEEPVSQWASAEEPKPEDVRAIPGDYRLRAGDIVRIGIFELYQDGQLVQDDYVVSETGKILLPVIGTVQAAGQTESQLQRQVRLLLMPNILKDPSVTVALRDSQQRRFSVLGSGVPKPGAYEIPRYDFRLSEGLALAGGPDQFNVSAIYVTRAAETAVAGGPETPMGELELITPGSPAGRVPSRPTVPQPTTPTQPRPGRDIPEPSQPAQRYELEREMLDLIAPSAQNGWPESDKVVADATPLPSEPVLPPIPEPSRQVAVAQSHTEVSMPDLPAGFRLLTPRSMESGRVNPNELVQTMAEFGDAGATAQPTAPASASQRDHVEWDYQNGRWVLVEQGPGGPQPVAPETPGAGGPSLPAENEWADAIQTRLLKIPIDKLHDRRYDIVLRPGDTIHVPVDLVGEFWIGGNVVRSGAINMTGRPMTLKMAIAAAGGLGPLADPKYCEVIRRIDSESEEIVLVNLDKIASGELPDFFIKPNDLINVGTNPTARWRAVLRNSFRAAYGFGFVYDRNFADADYGDGFRMPSWF